MKAAHVQKAATYIAIMNSLSPERKGFDPTELLLGHFIANGKLTIEDREWLNGIIGTAFRQHVLPAIAAKLHELGVEE